LRGARSTRVCTGATTGTANGVSEPRHAAQARTASWSTTRAASTSGWCVGR
jgi:hypothetical protein